MQTQKIILPEKFVNFLVNLPENGMGYQLVKIFLKDGKVLRKHKVINSSVLILDAAESITLSQISKLELEK
jgi:formylmethanofuran dehydrogenase subunit A